MKITTRGMLCAALALATASAASAQNNAGTTLGEDPDLKPTWHVAGGVAQPSMDGMENAWGSGASLLGGMQLPYARMKFAGLNTIVSVRGDVGLALFGLDSDGFGRDIGAPGIEFEGGSLTAITGAVSVKAALPLGPVHPYLTAGGAMIKWSTDEIEASNGASIPDISMDDQLGFTLGAGVDLMRLGRIRLFAEAQLVSSLGGDAYRPIHFGARF